MGSMAVKVRNQCRENNINVEQYDLIWNERFVQLGDPKFLGYNRG